MSDRSTNSAKGTLDIMIKSAADQINRLEDVSRGEEFQEVRSTAAVNNPAWL